MRLWQSVVRGGVMALCFGINLGTPQRIASGAPQEPALPQQPLVIREVQMRTNVTVTIHTTIYEVRGVRIDGQWIPLPNGTSVTFRFQSNIWSNLP